MEEFTKTLEKALVQTMERCKKDKKCKSCNNSLFGGRTLFTLFNSPLCDKFPHTWNEVFTRDLAKFIAKTLFDVGYFDN